MRRRKSPDSAPWMIRWSYVEVSVITLLTARRASVSSAAPWYSAGYSIAPTPMMAPWPAINRGTEWTVPMVPGLVRLIVVPAKSSAVSLPVRALRIRSSYAAQKREKSTVSAFLMFGTTSEREPSSLARSTARPRLTWSGEVTAGFPSAVVKARFITGKSASARTSAKPMTWVNDTLPPRPRRRWLLITTRLSMSSLAGITRTLVAVGTVRLASMLETTRAAAPRSGDVVGGGGADGSRRGWELSRSLDDAGSEAAGRLVGPRRDSEALSPSLRSVAPLLLTSLARPDEPSVGVGAGVAAGSFEDLVVVEPLVEVVDVVEAPVWDSAGW